MQAQYMRVLYSVSGADVIYKLEGVLVSSRHEFCTVALSVILDAMACPYPPRCVGQVTDSASFNLSVNRADIYTAYLLVCEPGASFVGEVTSVFINRDPEGGLTQHLPIELVMLPSIYSVRQG